VLFVWIFEFRKAAGGLLFQDFQDPDVGSPSGFGAWE
jgi:hypothetical protein